MCHLADRWHKEYTATTYTTVKTTNGTASQIHRLGDTSSCQGSYAETLMCEMPPSPGPNTRFWSQNDFDHKDNYDNNGIQPAHSTRGMSEVPAHKMVP